MFDEISKKIENAKIIPVVKMDNPDLALDLAKALLNGGITAIEVTFRTTEGEEGFRKIAECIKKISKECPQILIGAGTVINKDLAKKAADAGAQFIVSPGFNPSTVDWCIENKIPIYPGVNNPSLIEQALEKGLSVLKFFPAELSGGIKMLNALRGPFPTVKFMATGGISLSNLKDYLSCKNIVAIGGSWIVEESLINSKNWNEIEKLSKKAIEVISK